MTENKPLIIPELVALDAAAGPGKEDVIEFLATTVAGAGRASSPDGLAADAKKRESTAPTGIPGGIAIPHCRSAHVLAPSLGFARLAEPVDFGAADGQAADLVFMIAAPDGADDFHLQLLAKLARGLMQSDFTDALRQAADAEEVARIVTGQVQPELLEGGGEAEDGAVSEAAGSADSAEGVGAAKSRAAAATSAPAAGETVIVGVSSCPTGIAHTFMAAEALEQAGKDRGITVAIEGQGSGKIDALDPDLIKRATAVIFAHDLPVKGRERFAGKPVIDVGVKAAVNDAGSLVDKALAAADDPSAARVPAGGESSEESEEGSEHWARRLQRSVMTGVSYMIPFVAAGGLLIALGFLLGGYDIALTPEGADKSMAEVVAHDYTLWSLPGSVEGAAGSGLTLYLGSVFFLLGQAAMNFLVPALAGYIAFGLAGRPGIAPGFAMGAIAVSVGSGFIGGLIGGILAGYVAAWFTGLNVPAWLRGLMPVVIIPLGTTLAVGAVMYMLLGRPLASLMTALQDGLTSMSQGGSAVFLGIILGLMMCFDLGGPVNKAAYLFGTAGLSAASAANTAPYEIMATVMAAGMVPPLAMSAATFLRSRLFTKAEVENGRSAWLLGLSFISEGAIPFAAADPLRVIPATMAGGAVTGAMTMAMHVGSRAPHGGVFVAFAITNFGGFLLAILAGAVVSTALVILLKGLGRHQGSKDGAAARPAA
ncbi:PTS fructose transporter subunit IIABC [Actinomyces naeslundii]|uniref:Phosphoenolpyruvate-dependent sugar PTS family porter, EIIA 2 n=2 Tax=Actinomyces naeslundii TaxID=1655 RepID=J3JKG1_ACTNH|nr:fructose-specific PTS transporter subunit EIIC [Actinomyces naeslundii]EJN85296.1 phosphoenolpyruvate-dependent sugar PTS family porter, EIIA 2 [Actinomyces naeslundii str. Howell 279]OMG35773.1 PTS lactose transporter subunit IIC [Actinomyces naeslundii]QQC21638.1 PTS sugar transporter subunit IIA [Actinomyces naeslundii]